MCALQIIDAITDDLVDFTREIVKIPSTTGQERKVAQAIFDKLSQFGLDETWIDGIGNVVGVLRGQGKGPNILLNGHMDIVPAGRLENWRYGPFDAVIDEHGIMHGRGTADMKGGLAALVFTMKLMKEIRDKGVNLPGDIIFSAVVFEEAAEMFGMEYLCTKTLPEKDLKFDICYLAEPTNGRINLGHRGKVEIVVETHGKTAHSSRPWQGVNALEKMLPVLDNIFNNIGPNLPSHPLLGKCSITVTNLVCKPGTMSIVPDECEISVDRRYLPGDTLESILAEFEALLKDIERIDPQFEAEVRVRTLLEKSYTGYEKEVKKHHPAWIMDNDHPLVIKTSEALRKVGVNADVGYFVGGVDGGFTAEVLGIPTIGFSGADESLAHTYEERTPIKTLITDTAGYVAILCELFDIDLSILSSRAAH